MPCHPPLTDEGVVRAQVLDALAVEIGDVDIAAHPNRDPRRCVEFADRRVRCFEH